MASRANIPALKKRIDSLQGQRERMSTMLIFELVPGTEAFQRCLDTIEDIDAAIDEASMRIREIEGLRTQPQGGSE